MSTESHSLPPLEYPLDCLCLFSGSWCLPCLYSHCLWLLLLTVSVSVWWFFVPTCIYSCCLWLFAADCRLFVSRCLSVMIYFCVKLPFLTFCLLSVFYIFVYICHSFGRSCFFLSLLVVSVCLLGISSVSWLSCCLSFCFLLFSLLCLLTDCLSPGCV